MDSAKHSSASILTPDTLLHALADPECFKGNRMQQVKILVDTLQEKVTAQIEVEITKSRDAAKALKKRLCGMAEFVALSLEQQDQITRPFTEFIQSVERQKLIAVIRDNLRRFEESDYQRLLSKMASWAQSPHVPIHSSQNKQITTPKPDSDIAAVKPEPRIEYVSCRSIRVSFDKAWLADESDVECYLEAMREALLAEIRIGKRIQI